MISFVAAPTAPLSVCSDDASRDGQAGGRERIGWPRVTQPRRFTRPSTVRLPTNELSVYEDGVVAFREQLNRFALSIGSQ